MKVTILAERLGIDIGKKVLSVRCRCTGHTGAEKEIATRCAAGVPGSTA